MSQKLNQVIYIALFACVIALCISINKCRNNASGLDQSIKYLSSMGDTIVQLKNGIAQKAAIEVSPELFESIAKENKVLTDMLKDAKIKLDNVKQSTRIITSTRIDTFEIPLSDTIPCPEFNAIAFNVDSVHYSIGGRVSKHSITFDKIRFPDSLYCVTAIKTHFFRQDEYLVTVKPSNPHVKIVGLTNLTVTENRKWWHAWYVKMGAGFVAGGYLTYRLSR